MSKEPYMAEAAFIYSVKPSSSYEYKFLSVPVCPVLYDKILELCKNAGMNITKGCTAMMLSWIIEHNLATDEINELISGVVKVENKCYNKSGGPDR